MHPLLLIYSAVHSDDPDYPVIPEKTEPGICAVTGEECETVPRTKLLGKSFTDGALLAAPGSDRVGVGAYVAMKYKWERMSSWICDGRTFTRLDRIGVRDMLFTEPPDRPWCAYATTSYKKHGGLRAVVNGDCRRVWLFETRLVDCTDMEKVNRWWDRLNAALRSGIGRAILETMVCPSHVMRRVGIRSWMEFEVWASPRHRTALYSFLCYLLPSQQELKAEKKNEEQDQGPDAAVHHSRENSDVQGKMRQLDIFSL